jgi:hypothetical protein
MFLSYCSFFLMNSARFCRLSASACSCISFCARSLDSSSSHDLFRNSPLLLPLLHFAIPPIFDGIVFLTLLFVLSLVISLVGFFAILLLVLHLVCQFFLHLALHFGSVLFIVLPFLPALHVLILVLVLFIVLLLPLHTFRLSCLIFRLFDSFAPFLHHLLDFASHPSTTYAAVLVSNVDGVLFQIGTANASHSLCILKFLFDPALLQLLASSSFLSSYVSFSKIIHIS